MKNSITRDSKFEILRIVSMIFIVAHHFSIFGFTIDEGEMLVFNSNKIIIDILSLGGKFGVNIFILISSYFIINSEFKLKRLIKIYGVVFFYSISILGIYFIGLKSYQTIGISEIIKSIFPILFCQYWFITDYIILMILSPFLNSIIQKLDKSMYKKLLIVLIVLSVFISGAIPKALEDMSNNLIWFIALYLIVGYIKKHIDLYKIKLSNSLLMSFLAYLLLVISVIIFNVLGYRLKNYKIISMSTYYLKQNSIFVFIASIYVFLAFLKLPQYSNKAINKIASTTFGVYLIHTNIIIKIFIWKNILKTETYFYSNYFFLYAITSIISVYIICTIIDLIRQATIEKIYLKLLNKIYSKNEKNLNKIWEMVINTEWLIKEK